MISLCFFIYFKSTSEKHPSARPNLASGMFACKFCADKFFKLNGQARTKHQNHCPFNPKNSPDLNSAQFSLLLPKDGYCPNCHKCVDGLRKHAIICYAEIQDFSSFLKYIVEANKQKTRTN